MEESIDILVYSFNNGEFLHCFDDQCEEVVNNEVLSFNYTDKQLDIEIENAEFNVEWCSKIHNGVQIVLVTLIPNTGKVIFPNELKRNMESTLSMLVEVERRLQIMGAMEDYKQIITAHNIIDKYCKK